MNRFFHEVIEPGVEWIPVLEVTHSERHNGRAHRITQTISRNVYTEFDRKLSRHLAATGQGGFPAYTVTLEAEAAGAGEPNHLSSAFHASVPHALREIAACAFERSGPVELTFCRSARPGGPRPTVSHKRRIAAAELEVLGTALGICAELGEPAFLDISGDFGVVTVAPPRGLNPVVMHLRNGTLALPSSPDSATAPFQWPIQAFAEHASTNIAAQSYLATVGHAIVAEKEAAILAFRLAAEKRILDFHHARAGRPLDGHWRQSAAALVARLAGGLGDTLNGLAEDARGIALDIAASVAASGGRNWAGFCPGAEPDYVLRPRAIG
jgi:hypothetical protein